MSPRRSECSVPGPIDPTPFGDELAGRVAGYLRQGGEVVYHHPYYRGMGRSSRDGAYLDADVWDAGLGHEGTNVTFPDRAAFVAWLSRQSDDSLYGHELQNSWLRSNQRITPARLEGHLAGAGRTDRDALGS